MLPIWLPKFIQSFESTALIQQANAISPKSNTWDYIVDLSPLCKIRPTVSETKWYGLRMLWSIIDIVQVIASILHNSLL